MTVTLALKDGWRLDDGNDMVHITEGAYRLVREVL